MIVPDQFGIFIFVSKMIVCTHCTIFLFDQKEKKILGEIKKVQITKISGIADGLEIEGTGTVEYMLNDESGNDVRI